MHGVEITELIKKFQLKNMTPDIDAEKIVLTHPEVNRPALQLAGFFDHFDNERVQIIGNVEQAYISAMEHDVKIKRYEQLVSSKIPCMVFRFPPMSVPVAAPGCSVNSALTRPFLALSWEFQSINSSVHCGGVGRV